MKIKKKRRELNLSLKKKIIQGLVGLSIAFTALQITDFFDATQANAWGQQTKVKEYYGDRSGANATPIYIEYTPIATQYSYYARSDTPDNRFYEEYYKSKFLWYSMVPRQNATAHEAFMGRMKENTQLELGTKTSKIKYYADTSMTLPYRLNLKTGSDSPWDNDGLRDGANTGTQMVTEGKFKGKYYEWRYLGYSTDGEAIANPYFPDDYPPKDNSDNYWRGRDWVYQSWYDGYANFNATRWDLPGNKQKKIDWLNKYLKPSHPDLFKNGHNASWWADRLSLRNNPDLSTGILMGWHTGGDDNDYYNTFVMQSPKKPNLRLTDLRIKEKDTGKVIGSVTRNTTDPYNFSVTNGSKNTYIDQGRTYVIEGTIKNMKENGMSAHNTSYTPVHAEVLVGYDKTVHEYNEYDEIYSGSKGCQPTSSTKSIKYNSSQNFKCEFTVPSNFKDEIEIGLRIPNGFFLKGDNTNNEDDISQLTFKRNPNDMAISKTIEFIDQDGNVVDDVIPEHTYDVRFYVSRPQGNTPVGAVGNAQNPFTTIDVTATDKGTISKSRKVVATQVLNKGKTIAVTANDIIQPLTNVIEACGRINAIHVQKGQNSPNGNDGWVCKTIQSDINISVKDFKVKPQSVFLPTGKTSSYENLRFDFMVTNFNEQKHSKDIPYVIKKKGKVIKQGIIKNVPANTPTMESVLIQNVYLTKGTHDFTVEVNPKPRRWLESVKGKSDPYDDNEASNGITVHETPKVVKCDVENTRNTWTTTYSVYEWWGYQDSYWVNGYYNYDYKGKIIGYTPGYRYYYCVTTKTKSSTQKINHYEEYKIDKVLFRSKITDDNNGGWIDIKGGKEGKVKAGYGFEIKVVARYTTNINTAPKPWSSGCSGKWVSPSTGTVDATSQITMTMPFKDKYGKDVKYTLNGVTSGSWYNETQTYEMPMRNVFGLKNTREIFVNEGAKDGKYKIKIETDGNFYGSYDKPYKKNLCDTEYVNITIVGSNTDDLNTHVTQ